MLKKLVRRFCAIGILLLVTPFVFGSVDGPVTFSQHYIERLDKQFHAASLRERALSALSSYTLRWSSLFAKPSVPTNFDDIDDMFEFLLAHTPPIAIVYPTEKYFYYYFSIPGERLSGNLRLVELDNQKLGMGYFPVSDAGGKSKHKLFSVQDGLSVEKCSDYWYTIRYRGITRRFRLSDIQSLEPHRFDLLPTEKFVSRVRDESGIIFILLFNTKTSAFYYILDEERPVVERLQQESDELFVGSRTKFVYFNDGQYNRKILVSIFGENVFNNNYFDGPFDQVPPDLNLRDMVYAAYPYTQFGGVDTNGNFLNTDSTRIAISPYSKYNSLKTVIDSVSQCKESTKTQGADEFWSCITYEEKRDFHKSSKLFSKDGKLITKRPTEEKLPATASEVRSTGKNSPKKK